jgi:hypothetical protein
MTILDPELATLDGLDKALHPLYTPKDGKFVFSGLKGYDPGATTKLQAVVEKERSNASTAANALKPWKTLFGDKDPQAIQAELDRVEEYKLAAKGKLDEKDLEERVTARLSSATKPLERKLNEASEKLAAAEQKLAQHEAAAKRSAVRGEVAKHALESGALPEAYGEGGGLLAVCEGVLEVTEDGKVVSRDGCGYPAGLEVPALLQQIQAKQGYFWGTSKGTGANAGNGGPRVAGGGKNPWLPESRNRTEQLRIKRENPALAKQYMSAPGAEA